MNPASMAVLTGLVGGAAIGALYFAMLWRDVRRLATRRRPGREFVLGTLLRLAALLCVVYLAVVVAPAMLLGGVPGFILARSLAVRWLSPRARPVAGA